MSSEAKSETSQQPAIENIQPTTEKVSDQSSHRLIYDTSIQRTLVDMKKSNTF